MEFRTIVDIPKPGFEIEPCEEILFVGSCFANEIGQRFREEGFPVTVNPYGTMYNPVSVFHTISKMKEMKGMKEMRNDGAVANSSFFVLHSSFKFKTVFITLGTNHVYREKETGKIVDNCEKRPAALFQEEKLTVDECADYLLKTVEVLSDQNPDVHVVFTVSPIRYRKYGYHESQLSKATLLMAVERLVQMRNENGKWRNDVAANLRFSYFPAYEIVLDELRDYRFYAADMLHPSVQAVEYIWERLVETYFSSRAKAFLDEWRPLKQVLAHKPFNPEAPDYKALMDKTMLKVAELRKKYPTFAL